jgi:hypothetical protein
LTALLPNTRGRPKRRWDEWSDEIVDISEEGDTDMRIDWIGMVNFYRQRMRLRLRGATVSSSAGSTSSTAASLAMISNLG